MSELTLEAYGYTTEEANVMRTIHRLTHEATGYGFMGGHTLGRLPPMPLAHEANVIARVQSLRTRNGVRAEPLDFATSTRWLAHFTHQARVTVPPPRAA